MGRGARWTAAGGGGCGVLQAAAGRALKWLLAAASAGRTILLLGIWRKKEYSKGELRKKREKL